MLIPSYEDWYALIFGNFHQENQFMSADPCSS